MTQRHWQVMPGGSLVKYVLNVARQRSATGNKATDSASKLRTSVPGGKINTAC